MYILKSIGQFKLLIWSSKFNMILFFRLVVMFPFYESHPVDNQMISLLNSGYVSAPSSGSEVNYKHVNKQLEPSGGNKRNLNGLSVLRNLDLLRIKYFQAIR